MLPFLLDLSLVMGDDSQLEIQWFQKCPNEIQLKHLELWSQSDIASIFCKRSGRSSVWSSRKGLLGSV